MNCDMCFTKNDTEHFNFYVMGSEGVNLCGACKIAVSNYISSVRSASSRSKLQTMKNKNKK